MSVVQIDGLWWPADDKVARRKILHDVEPAMRQMLPHIDGRDCIVQAGGNVGVYALALADHFRRVVTAEPDPVNAGCLARNLAARDTFKRIEAHAVALGAEAGDCRMVEVEPGNCGAHRIEPAAGFGIPVLRIDDLGLAACDAIWLDVEGYELAALKGARETIERWSPPIAIEDKGLGVAFGETHGDAPAWLKGLGYVQVDEIGRDKVFKRNIR